MLRSNTVQKLCCKKQDLPFDHLFTDKSHLCIKSNREVACLNFAEVSGKSGS